MKPIFFARSGRSYLHTQSPSALAPKPAKTDESHADADLHLILLRLNCYEPRSIYIYTIACVELQWLLVMEDCEFLFSLFRSSKFERHLLHAFLRRRRTWFDCYKLMCMDNSSTHS